VVAWSFFTERPEEKLLLHPILVLSHERGIAGILLVFQGVKTTGYWRQLQSLIQVSSRVLRSLRDSILT
jgi:hypothetical protein